jgi:uncharacterized protein (TIGR02646 family)
VIFIARGKSPDTLVDAPKKGDYYNKPAVVHTLHEMQHGKCCYCECKLPDKGHLKAVEHFAPKAIFKGLRNEWTNLLLACSQCNGEKSDAFPVILSTNEREDKVLYIKKQHSGAPAIIDPSSVNPEEHIAFDFSGEEWTDRFGVVMAKGGSVLWAETIKTVGLHSQFYSDLRWNHFSKVVTAHYTNLLQALRDKNQLSIKGYRGAFENLMAPETQFAGYVRAFARFKRLHQPPVNLTIPGV